MAKLPERTGLLRDAIKERIVERILDGTYGPGERIVESAVAAEFGVSQAPVREALRDLEQLGCVEYAPFRGSSVRALSVADLLEAFPVRSARSWPTCAGRPTPATCTR